MALRERDVEVRRKAILAQQAVQCRVGRVDEVADVRHAVQVRVARGDVERRQKEAPSGTDIGPGPPVREALGRQPEVTSQRLRDEVTEGIGPLLRRQPGWENHDPGGDK